MKNTMMQAIIDAAQNRGVSEETRQFMIIAARRGGKTWMLQVLMQYRMRFFAWHTKQTKKKPLDNTRNLVSRRKREGKN